MSTAKETVDVVGSVVENGMVAVENSMKSSKLEISDSEPDGASPVPAKSDAELATGGAVGDMKVGAGNGSNGDGNRSAGLRSDPFADLAGLRLGQDFVSELGLAKPIALIPVKKPSKTAFIRVHPDEAFRLQTAVIELRDEGEVYLVAKPLWPHLANESAFMPKLILLYIARPGDVVGLWVVRLPGADGRIDPYNQSALTIALTVATKSWTRVTANKHLGAYDCVVAPAGPSWGEPLWPNLTFQEILRIAFKDKIIESLDHPVLKRLRGEM